MNRSTHFRTNLQYGSLKIQGSKILTGRLLVGFLNRRKSSVLKISAKQIKTKHIYTIIMSSP